MEEVIQKIIYIENQAQKVMDSAEQEKLDRKNELEQSLKKMKESLLQDTNKKINTIREAEINEVKKEAQVKEAFCVSKMQDIQKLYEQKSEEWAVSLVDAVLKR
ncbi:MAG: hypothetical protein CVU84_05410 [Firmicutes bacterium HGW-Firmicutes-1]|nr:MAG: hypothetical protein CVU84_05410 [Firmicutes bacterium HGW-Firmicutes-1]